MVIDEDITREIKNYINIYIRKMMKERSFRSKYTFWDFIEILEGLIKLKKVSHFSAPTEVQWESTSRCNHRCYFCYFKHNLNSNINELTTEEAKEMIDELNDMGVLILTIEGGEPFVRKDMLEILRYIKKNTDICVDILTNGSLLSQPVIKEIYKLLDNKCDAIQVSLLAYNRKDHYNTTSADTFYKVVENTKELLKYGLNVRTNTVITKFNYNNLDKVYLLASEIGINSGFSVVPPFQFDDPIYREPEKFFEVIRSLNRAFKYEKQNSHTQIIGLPPFYFIPHVKSIVQQHFQEIYGYVNRTGCVAFSSKININYNGDVYPCVFLQYPEFRIGNIKEQKLRSIWTIDNNISKIFREYRMASPHKCGQCELSKICSGGCYGATYYKYKNFNKPDPRCKWRE